MALTGPETAIQGMAGRLAHGVQAIIAWAATGTRNWARADAAADETFENRLKGTDLTEFDDRWEGGEFGSTSAITFAQRLNEYASLDLGYASFDAMLTAKKWRVPQEFAEWWYQARREPLSAANIIPKADTNYLGTMTYGSAFVDGAAFVTTVRGHATAVALAGRIEGTVPEGVTIGTSTWTVSPVFTRADGTSYTQAAVAVPNGSPAGTKVQFGAQLLAGNEAAGQTIIGLAETEYFKAGERVLIWDDNCTGEICTIESVETDVSITLTAGTALRHSYTTAANAYCQALFTDVSACTTGSGGEAGDALEFGCRVDRANAA